MALLDAFISHQVWLQRNASHEVNELAPFIQQMRDEVRKQVLQFGDDNRTRQNLEKLLRDLEDILDGITTDWQDKLTEDLQALGGYEADWTTKTLTANVDAEFVTPSPEQVWSAAKWNPLALSDKPADLLGMMAGWGDTEINRLVTGVKMGFVQGKTTRQIVKEVVGPGGLADISQRNAATVIRTAINHVSTQARETTYKKNSDIVEKYEWVSTLDSRTSTTCFTAETELAPIAGMDAVMRGSYSGEVITVVLPDGKEFTGTPEHPVLTQFGWTPLKKINPSEHILYTVVDEVVVLEVVQGVNMPARADYIFNAVANFPSRKMVSTGASAADFYGDGVRLNGEVDIVSANCELRSYVNTGFSKQSEDMLLGSVHSPSLLPCDGSEHLLFGGELSGNMTPFDKLKLTDKTVENCFTNPRIPDASGRVDAGVKHLDSSLLVGESIVTNPSSGSTLHEAELLKECSNRSSGGSILLGYDARGNAISVRGTNIVSIDREFRTCHVYTLSSRLGYYIAGGAIVKNCRSRDGQKYDIGKGPLPPAHANCRSSTVPVISSEFDFLDKGAKRAAKGAEGGQQVDASTTYYEFLKQQPAWFVDEALGPVRGKIFRNSGISAEEFRTISVDGFGRPLTLNEMAELDKRVAEYLETL